MTTYNIYIENAGLNRVYEQIGLTKSKYLFAIEILAQAGYECTGVEYDGTISKPNVVRAFFAN